MLEKIYIYIILFMWKPDRSEPRNNQNMDLLTSANDHLDQLWTADWCVSRAKGGRRRAGWGLVLINLVWYRGKRGKTRLLLCTGHMKNSPGIASWLGSWSSAQLTCALLFAPFFSLFFLGGGVHLSAGSCPEQEHDDNRRRLNDDFGGTAALAKSLRVDLGHGLGTEQVCALCDGIESCVCMHASVGAYV